jgi:hypothetical protein
MNLFLLCPLTPPCRRGQGAHCLKDRNVTPYAKGSIVSEINMNKSLFPFGVILCLVFFSSLAPAQRQEGGYYGGGSHSGGHYHGYDYGHGSYHHGGGYGGWGYGYYPRGYWWGPGIYAYPGWRWPYPYPYVYRSYQPPPQVIEEPPEYSEPEQEQPYYWYYCQNPQGYYPYIKSCPGGWMQVVPNVTPSTP